ncbi:MAG: hypothetical protein MJY56_08150, partial [Bacteroidales bacterium]|nr:hypothetical protein [Bacteroidales bacterium]
MYAQIIKYVMWALLAISVVLIGWGAIAGLTSNDALPIDVMLYWSYALIAIALLAIVVIGIYVTAKNGAKGLIKLAAVVVGFCVLVGIAYVLAPATAVPVTGIEPTFGDLKLTDTVLNLTYFTCGVSILVILFSAIANAVRK